MVFSLKANKSKIISALVILAVLLVGVVFIPKMFSSPQSYLGETAEQRVEFLESFGWQVSQEPADQREVTIPVTFSNIYNTYNVMQKAQGFDLEPYAGKICTQYVYIVENYPNVESEVKATLLVYEGEIVGGDISSDEMNGFMHGFAANSEYFGETSSNLNSENSQLDDIIDETQNSNSSTTEPTDADVDTSSEVSMQMDKSGELVPVE